MYVISGMILQISPGLEASGANEICWAIVCDMYVAVGIVTQIVPGLEEYVGHE